MIIFKRIGVLVSPYGFLSSNESNQGILVATVEKRKRSHAKKKEGPGEGPRDAKRTKNEISTRVFFTTLPTVLWLDIADRILDICH